MERTTAQECVAFLEIGTLRVKRLIHSPLATFNYAFWSVCGFTYQKTSKPKKGNRPDPDSLMPMALENAYPKALEGLCHREH